MDPQMGAADLFSSRRGSSWLLRPGGLDRISVEEVGLPECGIIVRILVPEDLRRDECMQPELVAAQMILFYQRVHVEDLAVLADREFSSASELAVPEDLDFVITREIGKALYARMIRIGGRSGG